MRDMYLGGDSVLLVVDASLRLGGDERRGHGVASGRSARCHPIDVLRCDVLVGAEVQQLVLTPAAAHDRISLGIRRW